MKTNNSIITILLSVGVLLSVSHLIFATPLIIGSAFITCSLFFMLPHLTPIVKWQVYSFISIGVIGLLIGWYHNPSIDWQRSLTINIPLICIILGASMLKLVCTPSQKNRQSAGNKGIWQTLISTHLFSSVINISAMYIAADFFYRSAKLSDAHVAILSRAYTLSMLWSPMMAGMAIALTWSPQASIVYLLVMGMLLAILGLWFTARHATHLDGGQNDQFKGISMSIADLKIPVCLTLLVLLFNYAFDIDSVPLLVTGVSVGSVLLLVLIRHPKNGVSMVAEYASIQLPSMKNEIALFIAAGIFAQGLTTLATLILPEHLDMALNWLDCSLIMVLVTFLAYLGMHPIASIAVIGSCLHSAQFSSNTMALAFLVAWSLGALASPFSGTTMAITQRYRVPMKTLRANNQAYLLFCLSCSVVLLYISEIIR
ncbi:hypothetical protein KW505_21385 [Vibrio fluvialis]|nr:hypothetical protein [Vibrio fluvialis]